MVPTPNFTVLTNEQFQAILTDRDEALRREARALDIAESLEARIKAMEAGLVHYTKEEAAAFFCCSTKQMERYEKAGYIRPSKVGNKVTYPLVQLQAMAHTFQNHGIVHAISDSFPKRKRHQHTQQS